MPLLSACPEPLTHAVSNLTVQVSALLPTGIPVCPFRVHLGWANGDTEHHSTATSLKSIGRNRCFVPFRTYGDLQVVILEVIFFVFVMFCGERKLTAGGRMNGDEEMGSVAGVIQGGVARVAIEGKTRNSL